MNHDFPLSTHPQSHAEGDFWTQGATTAIAPYAPAAAGKTAGSRTNRPSPTQKIHRLLRGRYPLAFALAVACGVTAGTAGFMALPPKFETAGHVAVNPVIPNTGPGDNIVPMLTMFIQTQVNLISSPDVADRAIHDQSFTNNRAMVEAWVQAHPDMALPLSFSDPDQTFIRRWMEVHPNVSLPPTFSEAWKVAYPNASLPTVSEFASAVTAQRDKASAIINVSFADKNKLVAEAGCHAVLASYMFLHGATDEFSQVQERLDFDHAELQAAYKTKQHEDGLLDQLREKNGTSDLTEQINKMEVGLADYEERVQAAKLTFANAEAALNGRVPEQKAMSKIDIYNQIAAQPDGRQMQTYLNTWVTDQKELHILQDNLGANHPRIKMKQQIIEGDEKAVDDYARNYLSARGNRIPGANLNDHVTAEYVARLKLQYEDLVKERDAEKQAVAELDFQRGEINGVKERSNALTNQIENLNKSIRDLEAKQTLYKPVSLTDPGGEGSISTDKRKLVAGLGFTFGGLLPVGLMLLYGLTENRYRFSDDADEHSMLGTTLLGILPNLPDRLSDPQQAGVAAHCVHQIRTMLQISRSNDEPQVIAITSASSGDGKTSLTLALGLSYAACGARTLLVDCDLVAAGLTHRLNVVSTDGVLEAIANRALLEYVRTTDIADVAILPVGTTHAHHASTLSPVALRRLISEGRKHFDILIIDTGPLLGSIEASLVCAAADRSILAVARNQQRPLVERSIRHLQEIGANLAGVVFNRAHASDFERSMSGLALRSRPAPGPTGPAQAAAAKDMAGSFKKKAG